jgi:hypothetical protein
MILTIAASVVILLIAVMILFFGGARMTPSKDLGSLREKLDRLERRVVHLEGLARKSLHSIPLEDSASEMSEEGRYHTVSSGDTLSGIAERYGLTVSELCRLNQMTPNTVIRVGQMLLIGVSSQD